MKFLENSWNPRDFMIFMIFHDFYTRSWKRTAPRAQTPKSFPNHCNTKQIHRCRRGAFPTFYVKIMEMIKIMKFLEFYEISRNSMTIMNLWKFLIFVNLEAPKPWYSLGIIGVFAMSWFHMKIHFFTENSKFHDFSHFLYFWRISMKTHFFSKRGPMALRTPQNV